MSFEIVQIESYQYNIWDSFVKSSLNGTIFHNSFWLKALGNNFDLWGLYIKGNLKGGFVAPYKKFFGKKIIHPQFLTPYAGLVLEKYEGSNVRKISYEKKVVEKFARFLKNKYKWGILNLHPCVNNVMPFIWENYHAIPRYTYIKDIKDMKKVWEEMDKKLRNEIKKGISNGLTIEVEDSFEKALKLVEKSYKRNKKEFRSKMMRKYFFETKRQELCKSFICKDKKGQDIAAAVQVWDNKRMYNLLNGYDEKLRSTGAVSLCIYESMKFASNELSCEEFDFEGSMIPSIESFFRKHGGQLSIYFQIKWGPAINTLLNFNKIKKNIMVFFR